ncbi:MAG: hypothetical protein FJ087_21845, partial [Deltaproteobacteria bacterium]|nr:hypothetical protein [Deltaproteobacteria bacterium]
DGHGHLTDKRCYCGANGKYSAKVHDDCQDGDPAAYPGAGERCATAYDDDCDGDANELNSAGCSDWWLDADGDGHGHLTDKRCYCGANGKYSAKVHDDCQDGDPAAYPGAKERCGTAYDDNCDSDANDQNATGCTNFNYDGDFDNFGTSATRCYCVASGAWRGSNALDCDDTRATVYPGRGEDCSTAYDDNCAGGANERDAANCGSVWQDGDGDGYGNPSVSQCWCAPPAGWSGNAADCDDGRSAVSPAGTETCSTSYDDDCDSNTNDQNATGCSDWWRDGDGDGHGHPTDKRCYCVAYGSYNVKTHDDCQDGDASAYPGAAERCATTYDDNCNIECNGWTETATGCKNFWRDNDNDGYGDGKGSAPVYRCLCGAENKYKATNGTDANDENPAVH